MTSLSCGTMSRVAAGATQVVATADMLVAFLDERHAAGRDRWDYWSEGRLVLANAPSRRHKRIVDFLHNAMWPIADGLGLIFSHEVNVGTDQRESRIPDACVYAPDTPMASPEFFATLLMAIEVLSPGEESMAKVEFYSRHGVQEYLEVDPSTQRALLLRLAPSGPEPVGRSSILGVTVEQMTSLIRWDALP